MSALQNFHVQYVKQLLELFIWKRPNKIKLNAEKWITARQKATRRYISNETFNETRC